jgi:DNA primase
MAEFEKLNFLKFCKVHKIKQKLQRGWHQIYCPFCGGTADYLGFNEESQAFYCWKCGSHSKFKVLTELSSLNWNEIKEQFYTLGGKRVVIEKKVYNNESCKLPFYDDSFNPLGAVYLNGRRFDAEYLTNKYHLKTTTLHSRMANRIIIPVIVNGQTISYTTRDYSGVNKLRYIACEPEDEVSPLKHNLYNIDNCKEDWVIVVEGCFDCWRIGDNCVATFGTKVTDTQIEILRKFKKLYIMFDVGAKKELDSLSYKLAGFSEVEQIELDADDPAEMDEIELKEVKDYINANN